MRRVPLLLLLLFLAACDPASLGATAAAGVGSVVVIGRTPVDAAVSLASGRDCSVVRFDRGQSYCRPVEPPPAPPPYCTRSLGRVDCWREPPLAIPQPPKRGPRRKHLQMLEAINTALGGIATAAAEITELDNTVTPVNAGKLMADLTNAMEAINQIKRQLQQRLNDQTEGTDK